MRLPRMWLAEFVEGPLKGVAFPFESTLVFSGNEQSDNDKTVPIPEYLQSDESFELTLENGSPVLKQTSKTLSLVQNRVFQYKGVSLFVYRKGERNPNLRRYYFKRYRSVLLVTLLAHVSVAIVGYGINNFHQGEEFGDRISAIGSGYISEGVLYVTGKEDVKNLPSSWKNFIKPLASDKYEQVSQFNVAVVSEYSGKPLNMKIVRKDGYDEIRVDTKEDDNHFMALLGRHGISFYRDENDNWYVSDPTKVSELLKGAGLSHMLASVKSRADNAIIIPDDQFPYSIFYSSHSGRYLFDESKRYWEGSEVPKLGVIKSIAQDKVVFFDGEHTRVYLIDV